VVKLPWFRSANSVNPDGVLKVRLKPSPSAAAKRISRSSLPVGVIPGVVTLFPDPALLLAATTGVVAPCTATQIATPALPLSCASEYDVGSDPVATFTQARPRVYSWPLACDATCVQPAPGPVNWLTFPRSVNWAMISTSPAWTPDGRLIE